MTENLETFEAPEGLSKIKFTTTVDVSCPYRDGRDEYEVEIGYSPQKLCAASGSLEELIEGYKHATILGEELAVRVRERVSGTIDPRSLKLREEIEDLKAVLRLQEEASERILLLFAEQGIGRKGSKRESETWVFLRF